MDKLTIGVDSPGEKPYDGIFSGMEILAKF